MTLRLDDDDLDARWRDGLHAALLPVDVTGAEQRVSRLVSRRRRRRVRIVAVATAMGAVAAIGIALVVTRGDHAASVHATKRPQPQPGSDREAVSAVLHVTAEPSLTLRLDRATVPAGVIEIDYLDMGGTHTLRIDRLPRFRLTTPPSAQVARVRLTPGRYVLYCDIPGHRQAGEQAILTVKPSGPAPTVTGHSSSGETWTQVVAPYLPSGATLAPLPPPAPTVLSANPSTTILTYKLPSGRDLVAARMQATLDQERAGVIPGKDVDDRTAQGSRRFVITHNAAVSQQVIIQRPNGTTINLRIDSNPAVTYTTPPELNIDGLVALSDALDNTGSDLP